MQEQAATFIGSFGGAVVVSNPNTMVPVVQVESQSIVDLTEKKSSNSVKEKSKPAPVNRRGSVNRLEQVKHYDQPERFE